MESGRCPRCGAPYSASEVTGFGVLRPRTARSGGPRMEYTCQQCGRLIHLIPHGEGRYAPPGQPPPPPVPEAERRPPWVAGAPAAGQQPPQPAEPHAEPTAAEEPPPDPDDVDVDAPMDAGEALRLLGISPSADRAAIARAFHERSLTCHPDKVAHLDAEFQELAERKFKRLRKAYDLLLS